MARTSYQLTEDALIARSGDDVVIFGRWDRRFGYWRLDQATGLRSETPPDPVLDSRGVWLSPWPEAGAAEVAAFFSLIPLAVRRRAAAHGAGQWAELERLWALTATETAETS